MKTFRDRFFNVNCLLVERFWQLVIRVNWFGSNLKTRNICRLESQFKIPYSNSLDVITCYFENVNTDLEKESWPVVVTLGVGVVDFDDVTGGDGREVVLVQEQVVFDERSEVIVRKHGQLAFLAFNIIMVNVISRLLRLDFNCTIYWLYLIKNYQLLLSYG